MMLTLRQIQQRNTAFWKEQNRVHRERIEDPVLVQVLQGRLQAPFLTPHTSVEAILEEAAQTKYLTLQHHEPLIRADARREQARIAGKKKQPDALQRLIIELVRSDPQITESRLLEKLQDFPLPQPVDQVANGNITFEPGPGKPLKDAPISGLKHRLSRAKKSLKSR